jgi:hypothetical protein
MVTVLWDLHVVACVQGNAWVQRAVGPTCCCSLSWAEVWCCRTYMLLPVPGNAVVQCCRTYVLLQPVHGRGSWKEDPR